MKILVSGGCKNGKSMYGQELAKKLSEENKGKLYYLATMIPKGEEDDIRIKIHLEERAGWGFETIEVYKDFYRELKNMKKDDVVLFDSLTTALENAMFDENYNVSDVGIKNLCEDIEKIMDLDVNVIFISDNIYCDGIEYDEVTELYREKLAFLDKEVAKKADRVFEVSFDNVILFK